MIVVRVELRNMLRSKVPKSPSKAALVRALPAKAKSPILATLSGIITLVRAFWRKASPLIVVTL